MLPTIEPAKVEPGRVGIETVPPLGLPELDNSFYDSSLRYDLHPDLIFVFGSNERGAHGKGAALQAVTEYGAKYGQGFGLQGRSFAIPTKDFYIRTLPLSAST